MKPMLILLAVLILGIALYWHKHSRHRVEVGDGEKLEKVVLKIFEKAGKTEISKNRFIKGLKQHFHVNEKVANVLMSKAIRAGQVKTNGESVSLLGE